MDKEIVIRNRRITPLVLSQIQSVVENHWAKGRTYISRELCHLWDWRQPNGIYKDQVCRILLRKLEHKGHINLPPAKGGSADHSKRRYYVSPDPPPQICTEPVSGSVEEFPGIELRMVRRTPEEDLWNYFMYRYHYKSYRIIVGAHLKHMAFFQERPLACLAWSSSVFRIQDRDSFIGWNQDARSRNISLVANNSRFLILPWIRIKNLASHLLASSARFVSRNWLSFYNRPLYLLETFVDSSRFQGTCYQAANWIKVGQTKGHAKKNNRFYYHGQTKDIYVYPLSRDFRDRLRSNPDLGGVS